MAQEQEGDRLARLEQVIARQQEQIAGQQEQITRLAAALAQTAAEPAATASAAKESAEADPVAPARGDRRRARVARGETSSRRALLKLGGAAAAAGVAATAALVASEGGQTAQAGDNNNLVIGVANLGTAQTSLAITGSSSASPFFIVDASSSINTGAIAIQGSSTATNGIGVKGASNTGVGVFGVTNSGVGVNGSSDTGVGMSGLSTSSVGGSFQGGRAALNLGQGGAPGAPTANANNKGDIYLDSLATVWVCIGSGTPGTWVRLPSVANGAKGGVTTYLSTPVRLLDARTSSSSGLVNRGALAGNEVYTFGVAGLGGIPSNAQGLIANVTVLGPSAAGNLSLYPAGGSAPTVASMTFGSPGLFLANGVNVGIGSGGAINIQNQSSGTTPLVLDAVAFVS
jgi:hypothetical protein